MKLTYDRRYGVAYLRLHDKSAEVETIRVSDALNVDIAPDGTVYGIELLNAKRQLADLLRANLVIENQETGARTEVLPN